MLHNFYGELTPWVGPDGGGVRGFPRYLAVGDEALDLLCMFWRGGARCDMVVRSRVTWVPLEEKSKRLESDLTFQSVLLCNPEIDLGSPQPASGIPRTALHDRKT